MNQNTLMGFGLKPGIAHRTQTKLIQLLFFNEKHVLMARPNGNCGPWPDPTPQKCVTFSNTRMPQICFREESSADRICSRSRCSPSPAVMASPNSGIPIKVSYRSLPSAFPQASSSRLRLPSEVRFLKTRLVLKFGVLARGAASQRVGWGVRRSGYPEGQGTPPSWGPGGAVVGSVIRPPV